MRSKNLFQKNSSKKTTVKLSSFQTWKSAYFVYKNELKEVCLKSLMSGANFAHPIKGSYIIIMSSKVQQKQLQKVSLMEKLRHKTFGTDI